MSDHFPHIFLPDGPTEIAFTSRQARAAELRFPTRDREAHADRLAAAFRAAWQDGEDKHAVAQATRHGVYMEFASTPGFDLTIKSLENLQQGIRLLNVRRSGADECETLATVYVPKAKRGYFLDRITQYANLDNEGGKPKNAKLINSIEGIRAAVLESFWRPADLGKVPGADRQWVEVWFRSEADVRDDIAAVLDSMGIETRTEVLMFPEREVRLIKANKAELIQLLDSSDYIAEFRPAAHIVSSVTQLPNSAQAELVERLEERIHVDPHTNVAVCILDTGVNNGHPLLSPVTADADLHAFQQAWGTYDHQGHGTAMAGLATYGDILDLVKSSDTLTVRHVIESAKILPPPGHQPNPKHLWGAVTKQGISRAEIEAPGRQRVTCLAVTSDEDRDAGKPSSWSAALDELTSGYFDDGRRLIVVSAGNTKGNGWAQYPDANATDQVHDPAQAWNALTVGGYTAKTEITDQQLIDYLPLAGDGELSPHSTTSLVWPAAKWPVKPEIVFEAGNLAIGPDKWVTQTDDLEVLSLGHDPQTALFTSFCATSAAAAIASQFAARLQASYPQAWPETIRGLMIHSARWTEGLARQYPARTKTEHAQRLRMCGYGVPDFEIAASCMSNSLTLIAQAEIQPYELTAKGARTKDMHFYDLPWPTEVLRELGERQVELRVTLSYFIEPGPGEIGWQDRYRYASHGLRFDLNGPTETADEFIRRVNVKMRDGDPAPDTAGAQDHWVIGSKGRDIGSIHSDIWRGTAADLAESNLIAVYPVIGWWRERTNQHRVTRQTRYALVVSIATPEETVDIYTPVASKIGIPIEVVSA